MSTPGPATVVRTAQTSLRAVHRALTQPRWPGSIVARVGATRVSTGPSLPPPLFPSSFWLSGLLWLSGLFWLFWLPPSSSSAAAAVSPGGAPVRDGGAGGSEEHTSQLHSRPSLLLRLL